MQSGPPDRSPALNVTNRMPSSPPPISTTTTSGRAKPSPHGSTVWASDDRHHADAGGTATAYLQSLLQAAGQPRPRLPRDGPGQECRRGEGLREAPRPEVRLHRGVSPEGTRDL